MIWILGAQIFSIFYLNPCYTSGIDCSSFCKIIVDYRQNSFHFISLSELYKEVWKGWRNAFNYFFIYVMAYCDLPFLFPVVVMNSLQRCVYLWFPGKQDTGNYECNFILYTSLGPLTLREQVYLDGKLSSQSTLYLLDNHDNTLELILSVC